MCTTVLGFDPGSPVPVVLIGVRDEFLDRAWVGPGRHWPRWPDLVGGQDLLAGGTWLAVNSATPRVACVLNGRGTSAAEDARLSRGELPLLLAAGEIGGGNDPTIAHPTSADHALSSLDLPRYDPFHLLLATPDAARLWSWDGDELVEQNLAPGLHFVVNSGLEGGGRDGSGDGSPEAEHMQARVDHFRPLLAAAHRPAPLPQRPGPVSAAWGEWLSIADGGGLDSSDPRALLVRGNYLDRAWGSSSVSLVALTTQGARYDFRATPAAQAAQAAQAPQAAQPTQGSTAGWTTILPPTASSSDR